MVTLALLGILLLLATVLLRVASVPRQARRLRALLPPRLSDRLLIGLLLLATIPAGALVLSLVQHEVTARNEANTQALRFAVTDAAQKVDEMIDRHLLAMRGIAALLALDSDQDRDRLGSRLAALHTAHPHLLTMLVADSQGAILAATRFSEGHSTVARSSNGLVADRSYFREPMRTGQPYLSSVFRGRGLGTDVIVAVSAPILKDGRPVGVVEGSLDLRAFATPPRDATSYFFLADKTGRLVVADPRSELAPLADAANFSATKSEVVDSKALRLRGSGQGALFLLQRAVSTHGWQVIHAVPRAGLLDSLAEEAGTFAPIIALATLAAVVFAFALQRMLATPLAALSRQLREFRADGPPGQLQRVASDTDEFIGLQKLVNRFGSRVRAQHKELQRNLKHSRLLRDQLARTVGQREREIQARTTELARLNSELERLSSIDSLTQVANRRSFDVELDRVWRAAQRESRPMSLLMIDVDYFKQFNDRHGHPEGDICLQRVAALLKNGLLRPTDFVARYGGEEFAVILPHTDGDGALHVAERLRHAVESAVIKSAKNPADRSVTVSVGYSSATPGPLLSPAAVLDAADVALYMAKQQGRNRSCGQSPAMLATAAPSADTAAPG